MKKGGDGAEPKRSSEEEMGRVEGFKGGKKISLLPPSERGGVMTQMR